MRSKWKRLLLTTVAIGMASSVTAFAARVNMNLFYNGKNHAYSASEITVKIDGKTMVPKDMPAVSIDGRTMLPMRQIAQELGCEVIWNEAAQQVYVVNKEYALVFTINNKVGQQNGKDFTMDVPPMIVNDRTMLPVRALAKALDLDITWDDPSRTVLIQTEKETTPPPVKPVDPPVKPVEPEKPVDPPVKPVDPPVVTPPAATVTLNKVGLPASKTADQVFTIQASDEIPRWEEVKVAKDKIVLDFYGASSALSSKITATNSSIVSAVRTAEHTAADGTPYTRVVFDLAAHKNYEVEESRDGTRLQVTFDKVTVKDVSADHRNKKDVITIKGDGALGANVFKLSNPNRVVVDIPNVISDVDERLDVSDLQYVFNGRAGMFTDTTLRLVFEVDEMTDYSYSETDNGGTLTISSNAMEHMVYSSSKGLLSMDKEKAFKTGDVKLNDHYLDGYFDVILPGDFSAVYGEGTYDINDNVLKSIKIFTSGGKTTIRFYQNRISCYSIKEEGGKYVIHIKNPRDVYDKVLLLDAGHGGKDPGSSANGIVEKQINLTIMQKVANKLQGSGIKVYVTRNSDVYPANGDRAKTANAIADAMVSIHMNSATAVANGTEVLFANHSNDATSKLTSKKFAEIVQRSIIAATGNTDRGLKDRPDILILNSTKVPTILIETVFISNPGDAMKINTPAYQDKMAGAIANAIKEAFFNYNL